MSRRNHIKRAKILRGRLHIPYGSFMKFRSQSFRTKIFHTLPRTHQKNRQRAQAMRGYYHE